MQKGCARYECMQHAMNSFVPLACLAPPLLNMLYAMKEENNTTYASKE